MHFTCNGTKSFQNNLCYKKTIWNRCCSPLGKDETDLILLTSYNGKDNIMCCINPLSLIFGITLVANEKTVPCFSLYKVWHKINIAEDLILVFVLNSTVTNLISGKKKKSTRAKQRFKLQKHRDHFIVMVGKAWFDSSFLGGFIEISSFCVCRFGFFF